MNTCFLLNVCIKYKDLCDKRQNFCEYLCTFKHFIRQVSISGREREVHSDAHYYMFIFFVSASHLFFRRISIGTENGNSCTRGTFIVEFLMRWNLKGIYALPELFNLGPKTVFLLKMSVM